jgi:hypothetical protein
MTRTTLVTLVAVYGSESWFLTTKKEGRWVPFEKRVLRRIFELTERMLYEDRENNKMCSVTCTIMFIRLADK